VCRHTNLRLNPYEEGRDIYIDIFDSSSLTAAIVQHFVPGGAIVHAAPQTCCLAGLSRTLKTFQAIPFETSGELHALALLKRLQGPLNQAIIVQEDVEGYLVMHRVSFIMLPLWVASWLLTGCDL
jgi:hypothetical protein